MLACGHVSGATEFSISSVLTLVPHLWGSGGHQGDGFLLPQPAGSLAGPFLPQESRWCLSVCYLNGLVACLMHWGTRGLVYLRRGCLRPGCPGLGCWGVQGQSAQGWGVRGWARPQDSTPGCFVFSVVSWGSQAHRHLPGRVAGGRGACVPGVDSCAQCRLGPCQLGWSRGRVMQ